MAVIFTVSMVAVKVAHTVRATFEPAGNVPMLLTTSLPNGWSNHEYIATVRARDVDLGNRLSMTALGLPDGMYLTNCQQFVLSASERLHCDLGGTPINPGTYTVKIGVFDNHGNAATRLYPVQITVQP